MVEEFENSGGGLAKPVWGGKLGMNRGLCKTKYLDANFEKSVHFI